MARRRNSGTRAAPILLAEALQEFTAALGLEQKLSEYQVMTSWESIVGEQIARVATPLHIEKGILLVSVASAPWRAELSMRRREIRERINARMGRNVVRDIRFR